MSTTHERNDQINLVVTEDQKTRWQTHLAENGDEFQSLSHLIRQSVERVVNNSSQAEQTSSTSTCDKSEILEAIGRVDEKLQEVESRVTRIEKQVRHDPDIRELANRLFECLPTKQALLNYEQSVVKAGSRPPDEILRRSNSGRVEDLATTLDEPQHRVREAIERLQRDTHQIHVMTHDDETRHFKEG